MENETSLVDLAYEYMRTFYKTKRKKNNVKVPFANILLAVGEKKGITDQNELLKLASAFYTSLTIDGRFFQKEDNTWSLKEHEKFEDIHIVNITSDQDIDDMEDSEVEESDEGLEEFTDDDNDDDKEDNNEYHIKVNTDEDDENN